MKRVIVTTICSISILSSLFAQNADSVPNLFSPSSFSTTKAFITSLGEATTVVELPSDRNIALAMTTPDYPVTPGDYYSLSFVTSAGPVATTLIVEVDCSINLTNIGSIDARGMRFVDLKTVVERHVLEAYPLSSPQLVIQYCGIFPVYVRGEVPTASIVYLWGLSRLSDLWKGVTPYASYRDVSIRSAGGEVKIYDLFKAWRKGDLSHDPRLKPGDTVTFPKFSRSVTVTGAVRRPGTYQLVSSDGLKELIEEYCDGFSPKADSTRALLTRVGRSTDNVGEARVIDYAKSLRFELQDSDSIVVSSSLESLPAAYFEGALVSDAKSSVLDTSLRIPYVFYPGETLSQAIRVLGTKLSPVSDLAGAYVVRKGEAKPVDLSKFMYSNDFNADFALEPNDVVYIPFRKLYVYVNGAVALPNKYPYAPGRTWDYYIGLAGGLLETRNSFSKVKISDSRGRFFGKERIIQPEDTIIAAENDFLYNAGRLATVSAMVVSIVNLILNISNMD